MAGKKRFRAGVDGGPGAIGFASVEIDGEGRPFRFARVAVRRFPSGIETGDDLPVSIARRIKKSVRTQRKTVKARRRDVLDYLATNFRPDMSVDPYEARALCVGTEPVAPGVIGRALYHLSKHRGVDVKAQEQAIAALEAAEAAGSDDMVDAEGARAKSKRKPVKNSATLSDDETSLASQRKKELGPVKQGVERLEAALSGSRETLGVYLKNRLGRGETVRFRPVVSGVKTVYPLMPSRALVLHEIDTIIAAQRPFHPSLSEDFALRFKELAFPKRTFQVQPPLPCTICPDEPRLERGAATTELLRILGDVANLRLIDGERPRFLTWEEASRVVVLLSERGGTSVPYASIRAALGLSEHVFTREVKATMDGLRPDRVRQALRRAGETLPVCPPAVAGDPAAVLSVLAEEAKRLDAVVAGLCDRLPEADALVVGALLPKRRPRIGRRATDALIDRIIEGPVDDRMMRMDEALTDISARIGGRAPDPRGLPRLPYYGAVLTDDVRPGTGREGDGPVERHGRLTNAPVHRLLRELEAMLNRFADRYGAMPEQIIVETADEIDASEGARERRRKNQSRNNQDNRRIDGLLDLLRQPRNRTGAVRVKLWLQQGGRISLDAKSNPVAKDGRVVVDRDALCPYSGKAIGLDALFDAGTIQIDHIIPYPQSLDNRLQNLALSYAGENLQKGNRTPYEALRHDPARLETMKAAVAIQPRSQRWRYGPDALERYADETGGFLPRHLQDTRYGARVARRYLSTVADVVSVKGALTAMLRRAWGLDSLIGEIGGFVPDGKAGEKSRLDLRHHAIDAAVLAVVDRSLVQRVATAIRRWNLAAGRQEAIEVDLPWPTFREDLKERLQRLVVSHQPDRGVSGALHNETLYGPPRSKNARELRADGVLRVSLERMTEGQAEEVLIPEARAKILDALKSARDAERLAAEAEGRKARPVSVAAATANIDFGLGTKPQRFRVAVRKSSITVIGRSGAERAVDASSVHRVDFYEDGKGGWRCVPMTMIDAAREEQGGRRSAQRTQSAVRPVLSLHRGDTIALLDKDDPSRVLIRVVKRLSPSDSNRCVMLASPCLAMSDSAYLEKVPFSALRKRKARTVSVCPIGDVKGLGELGTLRRE